MASIEDLLSQLPIGRIAQMLGVDEPTAAAATKQAVPALVHGMRANAADPARAAALAKAIAAHAKNAATGGANSVDVDGVDTADGEKIVGHVFGANTDQVSNLLGGAGGVSGDLIKKLLPMLAPLVMGFLAKSFIGGTKAADTGQAAAASAASAGGGLMGMLKDKLGGLFGGTKATTATSSSAAQVDSSGGLGDLLGASGGGLGDLLGGLLGGGGSGASSAGGGLGDLLGGLLGGGSK